MASQITSNIQTSNIENIKLHIAGPLWGESTGDQWIPLTKSQ